MKIYFKDTLEPKGLCVVLSQEGKPMLPEGHRLEPLCQTLIRASALKNGHGVLGAGDETSPCFVWAIGKEALSAPDKATRTGGRLWRTVSSYPQETIQICVDILDTETIQALAFGAFLRSERFEPYHTSFRPLPTIACQNLVFITPNAAQCQALFLKQMPLLESIHWARTLINQPSNVLHPESFVQHVKALAEFGVEVEILDKAQLQNQKFGALLGVAQGSAHPPYLAIMRWNGAEDPSAPPIALVGKGVTFDSGGISIKPANGMEEMKMDMAGAAVVCGVIRALALAKAPVNAVAVVALVENMVSGEAQRPGDVVFSLSGQTIEVLNTDAEGRLILADALWYTEDRFSPRHMVDVATLTGAISVALGPVYAGLFSNDSILSDALQHAGEMAGEPLWPMPLNAEYDKALNSTIADIKNITASGYGAGSCTAAQFLKRFVRKASWAHLDIAGVDLLKSPTDLSEKGGNAFGMHLLYQWILSAWNV